MVNHREAVVTTPLATGMTLRRTITAIQAKCWTPWMLRIAVGLLNGHFLSSHIVPVAVCTSSSYCIVFPASSTMVLCFKRVNLVSLSDAPLRFMGWDMCIMYNTSPGTRHLILNPQYLSMLVAFLNKCCAEHGFTLPKRSRC